MGLVALALLGGGGSDGHERGAWSGIGVPYGVRPSWGDLPSYGALAALAQEARRATPTPERVDEGVRGGNRTVRVAIPERIAALIAAYPWPYAEAIAVARCENRNLDPAIISPTGDYGIFQINEVHAGRVGGDLTRLLIPEVNVRVAYEIYSESG